MTAWQMAFGSIPLIFVASLVDESPVSWSIRFVLILTFIAIVITGFGWLLWVYALEKLEAGMASLITLAAPVIAIFSSALLLDESPNSTEAVGMVLITIALLFLGAQVSKNSST